MQIAKWKMESYQKSQRMSKASSVGSPSVQFSTSDLTLPLRKTRSQWLVQADQPSTELFPRIEAKNSIHRVTDKAEKDSYVLKQIHPKRQGRSTASVEGYESIRLPSVKLALLNLNCETLREVCRKLANCGPNSPYMQFFSEPSDRPATPPVNPITSNQCLLAELRGVAVERHKEKCLAKTGEAIKEMSTRPSANPVFTCEDDVFDPDLAAPPMSGIDKQT